TVRFFTNDDVSMTALASGSYAGTPGAHLVYVGFLPGLMLKWAYTAVPSIPWYTLMLYACGLAGVTAVTWVVWQARRWNAGRLLGPMIVITVCWGFMLFVRPGFTIAAFALGTAAICLLHAAARLEPTIARRSGLAAAALFGAAAAIRWDSMIGTLAICLPMIAVGLTRVDRRLALRIVGLAVAVVAVVSVCNFVADRPTDWAHYADFNSAREELHATQRLGAVLASPDDPDVQAMLTANDWTINDVFIFNTFFLEDPAYYDTEKVERLVAVSERPQFASGWSDAWSDIVTGRSVLLLAVCLSAALVALRNRRVAAVALVQLGWAGGACLYVSHAQRFPERIAFPIAIMLSLGLLTLGATTPAAPLGSRSWQRSRDVATWVLAGSFVLTAALPMLRNYSPITLSSGNDARVDRLVDQLRTLDEIDPEGRFVAVASAVDFAGANAFSVDPLFEDGRILWSSWNSQSPAQLRRLQRMGLTQDLLRSLLDQPHRYLVVRDTRALRFQRAYTERLGVRAEFVPLGSLGGATVYAIRTRERANG
ncbi:MAG: hypothetical protein ACOYMR_08800, partial [Ilumatobacteraceae bacterium]